MKPLRGKTIAVAAAVLGLLTLAGAAFASRELLVEELCLWDLESADPSKREAAAAWLGEHRSARAVPVLLERAAVDSFAWEALGKIGRPAVPALALELRRKLKTGFGQEDIEDVGEALVAIGQTVPDAARAVAQYLEDPALGVRAWALSKLASMGTGAQGALPAIKRLLRDRDHLVLENAVSALGAAGAGDGDVPPLLFGFVMRGRQLPAAEAALYGLGEAAAPYLVDQLRGSNPAARGVATRLLERIGSEAAGALVEALRDQDLEVRLLAAECLSTKKSAAGEAAAVLIEELESLDRRRLDRATTALFAFRGKVVPFLAGALSARSGETRARLAEVCGWIGSEAEEAVPALADALEDTSARVRSVSADALGEIGSGAGGAVDALTRALKDRELTVRSSAAAALGKIGSASRAALPELRKLTTGPHPELQDIARLAVAMIGDD